MANKAGRTELSETNADTLNVIWFHLMIYFNDFGNKR